MVVLRSAAALDSRFVRSEVDQALSEGRYAHRLFPVLLGDTPVESIPWILRRMHVLHVHGGEHRAYVEVAESIARALEASCATAEAATLDA